MTFACELAEVFHVSIVFDSKLDFAPSPRIEIPVEPKEKESVTITCSAVTPCPLYPPILNWNLQRHAHNKMEENTDGTFRITIQETLTLSDQDDGLNITCHVQYPVSEGKNVKTAVESKKVNVSCKTSKVFHWILSARYDHERSPSGSDVIFIFCLTFSSDAPKDTSVSASPSDCLSAGCLVNLSCSSRAKPPVSNFTWFKKSKAGDMKVFEGRVYSLNGTDGGVYYCVATNALGKQTSSMISLTNEGEQRTI